MSSYEAVIDDEPGGAARTIVLCVSAFFVCFLLWASLTELEEVTRADGRIIPSQKTQIVQTAEPGVIKELFVRLGQRVAKDDLLLQLDRTPTSVSLGEFEAQIRALSAQISRLQTEYEEGATGRYTCPPEIHRVAPEVCTNEQKLMSARADNFNGRIKVFEERVEQKRRELSETESNIIRLREGLALAEEELALIKPLAARHVVAETELLRVLRTVSDQKGQLKTTIETKARVESGLREALLQVNEQALLFKQATLSELTEKRAQLSVIHKSVRGAAERVRRTDIRSPVDGIVNEVVVTTQGAYLNAGDRVISIVPVDDNLLVEARIRPSDVAFVHPNQQATVKVTAFDFSIFGGLEGKVENVSADTLFDPVSKEAYYTVIIRTSESVLRTANKEYSVIPGMICDVDIITGNKTIMRYLLKPIDRAREYALRER